MSDEVEPVKLHDGQVSLHLGDCVEVCKRLAKEGVRVHSVVTDPPYEIGFMGRSWDSAGVAFDPDTWAAIGEVLLPGGHLLAFTSPRTYHRIAVAIEDAGFEIRDQIQWLYGTGFPKNHNISKAIDRQSVRDLKGDMVFGRDWDRIYAVTNRIRQARDDSDISNREIDERFGKTGMAGHWTAAETNSQPAIPQWDQWLILKELLQIGEDEDLDNEVWVLNGRKGKPGEGWTEREVLGEKVTADALAWYAEEERQAKIVEITEANTQIAEQWDGWGTALKPANEPIVVARKPISEKTVAQNVVKHGTGAVNIDGCRVGSEGATTRSEQTDTKTVGGWTTGHEVVELDAGRYPPNVILSHTAECKLLGSRIVETPALRDYTGLDAYPAELGEKHSDAGDLRTEGQKESGHAQVEDWECHPQCAVARINAQSGTSRARPDSRNTANLSAEKSPIYGKGWKRSPSALDDEGGGARFFPNFEAEEILPELLGENAPIIVARKPLSESTIAKNVLVHGVGGINIEGCRIKTDDDLNGGAYSGGETASRLFPMDRFEPDEFTQPSGRFPANIILGHNADCILKGEKRVETSMGRRGSEKSIGDKQGLFGIPATGEEVGFADADGKESVEDWECADECVVAELDEQSGHSQSANMPTKGRSRNAPHSQIYGGGKGMSPLKGQVCPEHGDEGGASRFFKTLQCTDDCVIAELDEQSGISNAGFAGKGSHGFKTDNENALYGKGTGSNTDGSPLTGGFGDTGGASKFFEKIDCSDDCVIAEMDKQSGETQSGQPRSDRGTGGIWSDGDGVPCGPQHGDDGGASRFFHKVHPHERFDIEAHNRVKDESQGIGDWPIDVEKPQEEEE